MPRNIIISGHSRIRTAIGETLKKIPLRINVVTFVDPQKPSQAKVGELDQSKGFYSPEEWVKEADLAILEESSFNSRQEALQVGEALRQLHGSSFLLLTSKPVQESDNRLLLEAADATFPASAIRQKRDLIIRLLYRRFSPLKPQKWQPINIGGSVNRELGYQIGLPSVEEGSASNDRPVSRSTEKGRS